MSEDGFHVHGPHDHALEHAAEHGGAHHDGDTGMASQLAVITAVLATVGALFSYMGGATQANAGLDKNEAAIKKTEAANQWNHYQSKSSKQGLAELASALVTDESKRTFYRSEVERYKTEKAEIQKEAQKLEAESRQWDEKSEAQMHEHHRWAQATTVLQVSIALAAIALLTRKRWLEWATVGLGAAGIALGGLAWFHL